MVMTTIVHDQAGIHVSYYETVKHKEGTLDLALTNPDDESHIKSDDTLEILGLTDDLAATAKLKVLLKHTDGTTEELPCIAC